MSINWYPGHMRKATQDMKKILSKVEVLVEVLDARIPVSSANPVIAQWCKDKPHIKLLNKSDLADPLLTQQWLEHFRLTERSNVLAVSTKYPSQYKIVEQLIKKLTAKKTERSENITVMVTGIPNVGKSSLINVLAGRAIAKTGNEPAITKGQQRIDCRNGIVLFDTPGILWPKLHSIKGAYRLAVTGSIKKTVIDFADIAFFAAEYLLTAYPQQLTARYKLATLPTTAMDFLTVIGKSRGCLGKGGSIDLNQISELFLTELREAKIARMSFESPAMIIQERADSMRQTATTQG